MSKKHIGLNTKLLLVIGFMLSFISILFTSAEYLEMRSMEMLIKAQDYENDVVIDKLRQLTISKTSEVKIFLSEIRNRDEQLSLLRKSMIKTVSQGILFAGVELVLWLISASLFSLLLIMVKKQRNHIQ